MLDPSEKEKTKAAVTGWRAIMAGRQNKSATGGNKNILKETANLSKKEASENNVVQEEANDEFSMKKAKQHMQKLLEAKQSQRAFKGTPQQIALKLQVLTEGDDERGIKGGNKVKVLGCEDAGLGVYKLTYLIVD